MLDCCVHTNGPSSLATPDMTVKHIVLAICCLLLNDVFVLVLQRLQLHSQAALSAQIYVFIRAIFCVLLYEILR